MANTLATENEVYEAIFVRDGKITEGSHCNIFFVKDKIVYTHPADSNILDGITRQIVMQLCKNLKIELREVAILEKDLITIDEAFLTGTTTQITPINKIDDNSIGSNGSIGPITKKLQDAFTELKKTYKRRA